MFALFIIFEILSKLYTINGVDYKIHTKIVINTEEKIIYTNHPNKMVKYYTKDNLKIYKDSIILWIFQDHVRAFVNRPCQRVTPLCSSSIL